MAMLNGWKQIAAYLNCGVRTAQRWQKELQLPVFRIRDADTGPVMADPQELDAWIRERAAKSLHRETASLSLLCREQEFKLRKNARDFVKAEIDLGWPFVELSLSSKDEESFNRRANAARTAYATAKRTLGKPRLLKKTERQELLPGLQKLKLRLQRLGGDF